MVFERKYDNFATFNKVYDRKWIFTTFFFVMLYIENLLKTYLNSASYTWK